MSVALATTTSSEGHHAATPTHVEPYAETFGLPSSILNIAAWDHEMVLDWAEAVHLSTSGIEKLADTSGIILNGKALEDAVIAQQILGGILDGEDLQTAVLELEALRILKRLQPATRVDAAGSAGCSASPLTSRDTFGYLDTPLSTVTPTSTSTAFLVHAEAWLTKIHSDINAMYTSTMVVPHHEHSPLATSDESAGATSSSSAAGSVTNFNAQRTTSWGADTGHCLAAQGIASQAAFQSIREKRHYHGSHLTTMNGAVRCDAMCSDEEDEDDEVEVPPVTDISNCTEKSVVGGACSGARTEELATSGNSSFSSVDLATNAATAPLAQQPADHHHHIPARNSRSYRYLVQPLENIHEAPGSPPRNTFATDVVISTGADEFDF
jgi:hypothetical protein